MHERGSMAQQRISTRSHLHIPCSSAVSEGPFMMRMAGGGWMYAAKLTLEDATGSVDAHLFADDGAQFFQVPLHACHWFTRSATVTRSSNCSTKMCS